MNTRIIIIFLLVCSNLIFSQESQILKKDVTSFNSIEIDSIINVLINSNKLLQKENSTTKGNINLYLGRIYKLKQDFSNSLKYFESSEKIFKELQDYNNLTLTYVLIGEFYRAKYNLVEAEKYLDIAKTYIDSKKITDKVRAEYWNRKAAIYIEKYSDFYKSIECSKKVLTIADKLNDESLQASSLNEIGYAYENLENPIAEDYYIKAIEINKNIGNKLNQSNIIINLIRLYHKQNRLNETKDFLDAGFTLIKEIDNVQTHKLYFEFAYIYYEDIKDYETALSYHKMFMVYEREEFSKKWNNHIIDVEKKFELNKKNNEIEVINLTLQNKTNELKDSNRILFFVGVLLVIAATFIFIIVYFFRKSKKGNHELKFLSDQNEFLLSEANHRINNNLQLVIILISDELRKQSNTNDQFEKVLLKIQSIASLHEHLYQTGDKSHIDISNYLQDVTSNFISVFKDYKIKTQISIDSILISADNAMYYGLLLTELFINSIKHAFNNQDDKLIVFRLKKTNQDLIFNYFDNGTVKKKKSIKPKLVDKLCRQVKIDYKIGILNGFNFTFKKRLLSR